MAARGLLGVKSRLSSQGGVAADEGTVAGIHAEKVDEEPGDRCIHSCNVCSLTDG